MEQNPGFVELRHSSSLMISIGSFGHERVTTMEEEFMKKHFERVRSAYLSLLSLGIGRMKTSHHGPGNNNV
jgi:hypothetical protein